MKKIVLFIIFIVFSSIIFSEKVADLPEVLLGEGVYVNKDFIYTKDDYTIHIYSMKDFKHVKQFGRKGEGPGEFKVTVNYTVFPKYLIVNSFRRVHFFTLDGSFIKEYIIPVGVQKIHPVEDNYIGTTSVIEANKKIPDYKSVDIYDKNFKKIKNIYKGTLGRGWLYFVSGTTKKQDRLMVKDYSDYIIYKDKVYFGNTKKGFCLIVYDSSGKKLHEINRNFEKLKVTEKYKQEVMKREREAPDWEKWEKTWNYIFPDYFPAYDNIIISDDKIYFVTYRIAGNKSEVIVTDLKGKFLRKTFLPVDPYSRDFQFSIYKDKVYYLVENEAEEMFELHVSPLK